MANPRDQVRFEGIGAVYATFKHDNTIVYDAAEEGGSAQVGLAVAVESEDTVTLVGDDEVVAGRLTRVGPGGECTVQIAGGMRLPGGDSATLTEGTPIIGDLGAAAAEGYVKTGTAVGSRGFIINSNTATAVVCYL